MGKLVVVCGAQFGSEGKGAIAGYLSAELGLLTASHPLHAIRVAGPNAGHTVVDSTGKAWKLRHVPVAAVTNPDARLYLADGSEIDPEVLNKEIAELDAAGFGVRGRLTVSPHATLLTEDHRRQEQESGLIARLGSTGAGVGAARAARAMRTAIRVGQVESIVDCKVLDLPDFDGSDYVLIEGTQGYGLGVHTDCYPKTTSSDCRAIDFMTMAGVSPWNWRRQDIEIWLVARTYPIRVAGNSGPLNDETSWEDLGLPPETTTVTKKTRRVGYWDGALVERAVQANGGPGMNIHLALTMVDYCYPELVGQTNLVGVHHDLGDWLFEIEAEVGLTPELLGTGPNSVIDRRL